MSEEEIISPLSRNSNTKIVKSIRKEFIKELYLKINLDVSRFFQGIDEIKIIECQDTGYRFYFPLNIYGDAAFYEELQKNDWYYMPWKWEHQIVMELVNEGENILEVGCAKGDFLKKLKDKLKVRETGLELNDYAIREANAKGLNIYNEMIEEHASKFIAYYDKVCTFQVLEHIPNIFEFIDSAIKSLKKGGKLIFSVPNNDSFIKDLDSPLNYPPHHMGLWNKKSLENMVNFFPLKLLDIFIENLQEYHYRSYISTKIKKIIPNYIMNKYLLKISYPLIKNIIRTFSKRIPGHTILAVYEKI